MMGFSYSSYPILVIILLGCLLLYPHLSYGMRKIPLPGIKPYPGFVRECGGGTGGKDKEYCRFRSRSAISNGTSEYESDGSAEIYFSCKKTTRGSGGNKASFCFCETGFVPVDALFHPLQWNYGEEKCLIGMGGPCGSDDGLTVHCKKGLECIQGRCRIPGKVKGGVEGSFCNDEVDCKSDMKCRKNGDDYEDEVKIKRCKKNK